MKAKHIISVFVLAAPFTLAACGGNQTSECPPNSVTVSTVEVIKEVEPEKWNVSFSGENIDFTGDSKVTKGKNYSFKAVAYPGFELKTITVNGTDVTATDGVYTVLADKDLAIVGVAEEKVVYNFKTVKGDTPSKGGSVTFDENHMQHLKTAFTADDKFVDKDGDGKTHYSEVGFALTEESWADAADANIALVTLELKDAGEDITKDLQAKSGSQSVWTVEHGFYAAGGDSFGKLQWPGVTLSDNEWVKGKTITFALAKNSKIAIRNTDGFDAVVKGIEFHKMVAAATAFEGTYSAVMDETTKDVYIQGAGGGSATLDMSKIIGAKETYEGKKIYFEMSRMDNNDSYGGKNFVLGPTVMKKRLYGGFDMNSDGVTDGAYKLGCDQVVGLVKIHIDVE